MDITAAFQGITHPLSELYNEIHLRGWEVTKVDLKNGEYVAQVKNPHGDQIERTGRDPQTALGSALIHIIRREHIRSFASRKLSWATTFTDQMEEIAKAYSKAPIFDPKAAAAWKELADDSVQRFKVLQQQLKIEVVDDPEPYETPQQMCEDVHNGKFKVSRANSQHPVWSTEQNVAFRTVHDVLGHCVAGGDFGWTGENMACAAHFPLLSPNAQKALFTECIGQTAYVAFYRAFGPQKVAFLDEYFEEAQGQENPVGHTGIPIEHTQAPTSTPTVPASPPAELWGAQSPGTPAPHQEGLGLTPVFTKKARVVEMPTQGWRKDMEFAGQHPFIYVEETGLIQIGQDGDHHSDLSRAGATNGHKGVVDKAQARFWFYGYTPQNIEVIAKELSKYFGFPLQYENDDGDWDSLHFAGVRRDPNHGWQPNFLSEPMYDANTQLVDPQTGADPLNIPTVQQHAQNLETRWWEESPEIQKQAVVNAFRAVLLSPRKNLRWNAIHYQHISHIPANETNPRHYWNALENARVNWNTYRGYPENSHKAYAHELNAYYTWFHRRNPELSFDEARRAVEEELLVMMQEEEHHLEQEGKSKEAEILEPEVGRRLKERLLTIMEADPDPETDRLRKRKWHKPKRKRKNAPNPDQQVLAYAPPDELSGRETPPDGVIQPSMEGGELLQDKEKYGAFMATHLKHLASISDHAEEIRRAALADLEHHDGTGHHFRSTVLALQIPGVGPKVTSFAWLLLCPSTSQLATIDVHMMDVLGHDYKHMNDRDYFKFERMLQARRDASGYQHVPLGQFQWAMWDFKRTGPGSNQDHSAFRPLDPQHYHTVDWHSPAVRYEDEGRWDNVPEWWEATAPAGDLAAEEWDDNVAPGHNRKTIPHVEEHSPVSLTF